MSEELPPDLLKVRDFCLKQLMMAYEEAGISGLCAEGRWEYALDRVRQLSEAELRKAALPESGSGSSTG